jgi:anti-sigma B factor antagonist
MSKKSSIMVAVCDQVVCIKVCGKADYTSTLDLRNRIDDLWRQGYPRFVFELCDCVGMDSTFLGTLSGLGLEASEGQAKKGPSLELFNPIPRISEVLENLGVAHLFKITDGVCPSPCNYEPLLKSPDVTRAEVTRNCLDAHKTLMDVNPNNVPKFKDVTQFLTEDLKRQESGQKNGN